MFTPYERYLELTSERTLHYVIEALASKKSVNVSVWEIVKYLATPGSGNGITALSWIGLEYGLITPEDIK